MKITRNKYCFLLLIVCCFINSAKAAGFTFNGQDITNIISPGQTLVFTPEGQTVDNVYLNLKKSYAQGGYVSVENEEIKSANLAFAELKSNKKDLMPFRKILAVTSDNWTCNGEYFKLSEKISALITNSICLKNTLLLVPDVELSARHLLFQNVGCDARSITLLSAEPASVYRMIRFTFGDQKIIPSAIQGIIDFTKDETTEPLIVLGATEVEILFSDSVFTKEQTKEQ
jgi:hypothetical protein